MICLPNVTLVATSSVRIDEHIQAMLKCAEEIEFGEMLFVSHEKPKNLPDKIKYVFYPKIESIMDFNYLMWEDVGWMVGTSHFLTCQDHAYIIRPDLWDDAWLFYDWIGAPWPIRENSYIANNGERVRVGNGGFSLRSTRMARMPREMGWELRQEQSYFNEDGNFAVYWRKEFLEQGIKYAPVEVAARFSYENPVPENQGIPSFGFHKFMNPANSIKIEELNE